MPLDTVATTAAPLGLMGGTFNPIHVGHLRAAEDIAEMFGLRELYFIPAARPPHKTTEPAVDFEHRLAMLELAVADRPGFMASAVEAALPGLSYTVNTIQYFADGPAAGRPLYFLLGLDAFLSVRLWQDYRRLFTLTDFVVFGRAGTLGRFENVESLLKEEVDSRYHWVEPEAAFCCPGFKSVYYRPGCRLEVSSTDLRQRLKAGLSVRYLVPEPVRIYIEGHNLYR